MLPTVIIRHRKENLRKCSLRGLEQRSDLHFVTYPHGHAPPLEGYVLLGLEGPEVSAADAAYGLVLVDGTWRYAQRIVEQWAGQLPTIVRTLPRQAVTAYPRAQTDCPDAQRGLATVEALYLAHLMTGRPVDGLLDQYHWREPFLRANEALVCALSTGGAASLR
jgi:pre-rRNA-processing protein TSR3